MAELVYETRQLRIATDLGVLTLFSGSAHKIMQRLLTGEENKQKVDLTRLLITVSQLEQIFLRRQIDILDDDEITNNYISVATAVLPDPESDAVKFSNGHPLIYTLSKDTRLKNRNLRITKDVYEASEGFEIRESDANILRNDSSALPSIRRAVFEYFVDGNVVLTDSYIKYVEECVGSKFYDEVVGLQLPENDGMRLLEISNIPDQYSDASCHCSLADDNDIIGVVAEPQDVAKKVEDAKIWIKQFPGLEEIIYKVL